MSSPPRPQTPTRSCPPIATVPRSPTSPTNILSPVPMSPTSPMVAARVLARVPSDDGSDISSDDSEGIAMYGSRRFKQLLPPTLVTLYDNNCGLFLVAMAQLFFACMSLSVKFLMTTTAMSTLTLIFVRMLITGGCCFATLLIQRDPYPFLGPPGVRRLLCFRGFCGFSGLLCAYQALRGLSVSDAVTIGFLTPSVTALVAYLLMGESFSFKEAISGCISLVGVVLISRPPFIFGHGWGSTPPVEPETAPSGEPDDAERMAGVTWALMGVCFSAGAYLSIRHIGKRASALHSIGYFSMACTIASGVGMLIWHADLEWPHDKRGFALIGLIGVFGFCAQACLTFGLQREKAGRAGLAMYLQIFFAVTLELVVFHIVPSFLSFVGTVIILSSAAWVAVSTLKANPPRTVDDPESQPISRTPSPLPGGQKTVRGELYSYSALATSDEAASSSSSLTLPVAGGAKE